jgi:anti-sigma-K factor RskA
MIEQRWVDLAGAYALDALEGDEKAAFEAQLARDPQLKKLVDEHREASAAIAEGAPHFDPPASLRARVLARAREARPPVPTAPPAASPRGRQTSWAAWTLLAASVAGLVWVGWANRSLRREGAVLTTELAALRDSLSGAQAELARYDSLTAALTGSDVRLASLTGDVERGLWLVWNPERNTLVVVASGLAPAAPGRTYQLWGIRSGQPPVGLGTFNTAEDGTALVALSPGVAPDFEVSALTDEPAGGSPQPTTQPFLVGPWRAARD